MGGVAVRRRVGQKKAASGVTGMGVLYALGTDIPSGRRNLPRAKRRWSARQRKQALGAALSALMIVGSAAFASLVGDAFWMDAPGVPAQPAPSAVESAGIPPDTPAPNAEEVFVWVSATGSRYHANAACSNMRDPREAPLSEAVSLGLTPCLRCRPPS